VKCALCSADAVAELGSRWLCDFHFDLATEAALLANIELGFLEIVGFDDQANEPWLRLTAAGIAHVEELLGGSPAGGIEHALYLLGREAD